MERWGLSDLSLDNDGLGLITGISYVLCHALGISEIFFTRACEEVE